MFPLGRIRRRASCVFQMLKVVTAFTVGHSITLAVAALGLVRRAKPSY